MMGNCAVCGDEVGDHPWESDLCPCCEIIRLRNCLRFISETCFQDPETAQFAERAIDGSSAVGEWDGDEQWDWSRAQYRP